MLCVGDSEQRECGVGASVNATMLSETLQVVGLSEAAARAVRLDVMLTGKLLWISYYTGKVIVTSYFGQLTHISVSISEVRVCE